MCFMLLCFRVVSLPMTKPEPISLKTNKNKTNKMCTTKLIEFNIRLSVDRNLRWVRKSKFVSHFGFISLLYSHTIVTQIHNQLSAIGNSPFQKLDFLRPSRSLLSFCYIRRNLCVSNQAKFHIRTGVSGILYRTNPLDDEINQFYLGFY